MTGGPTFGCIYDSAVCNSYYDSDVVDDGKSHSFYKALHENTSYMSSKLSYGEELDMFQGIRTNLGTDGMTMITGPEVPPLKIEANILRPASVILWYGVPEVRFILKERRRDSVLLLHPCRPATDPS